MAVSSDPFSEVLRAPDLWEQLAANSQTQQHLADPGFQSQIQKLVELANSEDAKSGDLMVSSKVSQKIAQSATYDPRLMQALLALQGQGLVVNEKDLKKAEDFGDMPRREPIQLEQLQLVNGITSAGEAKEKGNEYFKMGDFSAALAHYEKGIELLSKEEQVPAAKLATLLSNSALMLLKLRWPDRAKKAASKALAAIRQANDTSVDQSKLFYRRALACEQLKEHSLAVEDMQRALEQANKAGLDLKEQRRLKGEVDRMKKLQASHNEDVNTKRQEQQNEKQAEVQRLQGTKMGASKKEPKSVSMDASYLKEQDFSHLAKQLVMDVVKGVMHKCPSGAVIETTELNESQSKISASITTKRGQRALYYEMDLAVQWKASAAPSLKPKDGTAEMQGILRVYNIAHDTHFELGGDANVCYIYSLGWDPKVRGPWVDDITGAGGAPELFDLLAVKVDSVIHKLRAK